MKKIPQATASAEDDNRAVEIRISSVFVCGQIWILMNNYTWVYIVFIYGEILQLFYIIL